MDKMEFEGTVIDHSKDIFKVKVTENHIVTAKVSGKIRMNKIQIVVGDRVIVEVSPYDTSMGRIVSRLKQQKQYQQHQNSAVAVDETGDLNQQEE